MLSVEGWTTKQRILVILAHPDDPEFFCGASVARWIAAEHEVIYCLFTKGAKGSSDPDTDILELTRKRVEEQKAAAELLGVKTVIFLEYEDGELVPSIDVRKSVVKVIRQVQPDIVVGCDPDNLFPRPGRINHPDHIAAGRIVIEAIFPAAGNPLYFPELQQQGLLPHEVKELWLSSPSKGDILLDVTEFWEKKILALHQHASQIGDVEKFDKRMRSRHTQNSTLEFPRYEEKFKRIIFE
jgi:LmbE family N-acetylglucosaminyl deacetylase